MKINLKRLGYYILGLVTIPIILLLINFFKGEETVDTIKYEDILMPNADVSTKQYKFEGGTAFILTDSLDFLEFRDLDYSTNKEFIGIDFTKFNENAKNDYSNVLSLTLGVLSSLDENEKVEYFKYLNEYKPRGKCIAKKSNISDNEYVVDVELKGENLLLKTFELGEYNYTNPRCFKVEPKRFVMKNIIELNKDKVPFKAKIISDGKEKNSFEFKMTITDNSGKVIYKYPEKTEYEKRELKTLRSVEYIENEVNLKILPEAIAK